MKLSIFNNKKGFTIIETLIAIAIIMTAIAGPLTVAQRGLNAAVVARDQFIAQYLAQDAIEQYYYIHNTNVQSGSPWLTNMRSPWESPGQQCTFVDTEGEGCIIDSYDNSFDFVNPARQPDMYLTPNGFYTHNAPGNRLTQFKRTVFVEAPHDGVSSQNREVIFTAVVTWQNGRTVNSLSISKNIYNQ
jgi:type II secretory pathway pseudopilin PulG